MAFIGSTFLGHAEAVAVLEIRGIDADLLVRAAAAHHESDFDPFGSRGQGVELGQGRTDDAFGHVRRGVVFGAGEIDIDERGIVQIALRKIGSLHRAIGQIRVLAIGRGQVRPAEIRACKIRSRIDASFNTAFLRLECLNEPLKLPPNRSARRIRTTQAACM